jgi:hypothetical protein
MNPGLARHTSRTGEPRLTARAFGVMGSHGDRLPRLNGGA